MHSIVRDLADAVSIQAQVTNRLWIATMTVAIIGVRPPPRPTIPCPGTPATPALIDLPFGLGAAEPAWFYGMTFAMLAILIVAFCSAHAQQLRAYGLSVSKVDSLPKQSEKNGEVTLRDLFDLYQSPSIVRIAPLSQVLLRFGEKWRKPGVIFYSVLKPVAAIVYFMLPSVALFTIASHLHPTGICWLPVILAGLLASIAVLLVFTIEMIQMVSTIQRLWKAAE